MKDLNTTRWIWRCVSCDDVVVSYSHIRHNMNTCECGKTSVDLEEHYCRTVGQQPEILSIKEMNDGVWGKRLKTKD